MQHNLSALAIPFAFAVSIAVPGAIGLGATKLPDAELSALSGAYQRAYEQGFTQAFPMTAFARDAFTAANLATFRQTNPDVVIGEGDWLFTIEEFQPPVATVNFAAKLNETNKILSEQGITLVPLVVPDKARIYADKLPRTRGDRLDDRYAISLDVLDRLGFAPIDLASVLNTARVHQPTFMRTDTHWSPQGAELAALRLADAAAIANVGSTAFETHVLADQPFDGDLMRFVDTGRFANWVGIAAERIDLPTTTAADAGGLGLFDDAAIGIVLVGTSYSARSEFNFEGALKAATRLDLVNLSEEGQGPFAPMAKALENGTIAQIGPQFVIWEIPERYIQTWSLE